MKHIRKRQWINSMFNKVFFRSQRRNTLEIWRKTMLIEHLDCTGGVWKGVSKWSILQERYSKVSKACFLMRSLIWSCLWCSPIFSEDFCDRFPIFVIFSPWHYINCFKSETQAWSAVGSDLCLHIFVVRAPNFGKGGKIATSYWWTTTERLLGPFSSLSEHNASTL